MTLALKIFNMEGPDGKPAVIEIVDVSVLPHRIITTELKPGDLGNRNWFGVHGTQHLRIFHPISNRTLSFSESKESAVMRNALSQVEGMRLPAPPAPPTSLPEEPKRDADGMWAYGDFRVLDPLTAWFEYAHDLRSLLDQREETIRGLCKDAATVQTEIEFIRAIVDGKGKPLQDAHLDTIANNLDAAVAQAAERGEGK